MAVRNFRDPVVWQKAMDLLESIYKVTVAFPKEEIYGLTSQMRRAAVSIPSNIAEGHGRSTDKELQHFLWISHGSLRELETQVLIAQRLTYLDHETSERLIERTSEVGRLLNGFIRTLK
jgi:four helix bundle protein